MTSTEYLAQATQVGSQYTGQIWLAELGMYYYKARIYDRTLPVLADGPGWVQE